jgi:hypothetical protein
MRTERRRDSVFEDIAQRQQAVTIVFHQPPPIPRPRVIIAALPYPALLIVLGVAESAPGVMFPVQLVDRQLDELRIVEVEPRPQYRDLFDGVPI